MKYTNRLGLPAPLASAVIRDTYVKAGDISVTAIISPPRKRILEKRHDEEISVDVSDQLWMLLGSSVHAILERADTSGHLAEEVMTVCVGDAMLKGQPDLLDGDGLLSDYKITSTYSFLLGEKEDWISQLNCYAWLYSQCGFEVKRALIVAILRDWMVSRAETDPGYPQSGVIVKEIPLWSRSAQEEFVYSRVVLHMDAEKLADDELEVCSPTERWQKADSFAVKKKGNKRATKVFDNEPAAQAFATSSAAFEVEHRPGQSLRCLRYCSAKPFCYFGRGLDDASTETDQG